MSFENITGQRFGFLKVAQRAGIAPLKWLVRCDLCGSTWAETHDRLRTNPTCRNSSCAKRQELEQFQAQRGTVTYRPALRYDEPPF
jgi:hypothetical protein